MRLAAAQMANPATFAVGADLLSVEDLADKHPAEFAQWSAHTALPPPACALLALLYPIRGLGSGELGRGLQISKAELARKLGRSRSVTCEAVAAAIDAGYVKTFAPLRTVSAITGGEFTSIVAKDGRLRSRLNVCGVLYLTAAGARLMDDLGWSRTRVRDGQGQKRMGAVGWLFKKFRSLWSRLALRWRRSPIARTPKEEAKTKDLNSCDRSRGTRLVENTGAPAVRGVPFGDAIHSAYGAEGAQISGRPRPRTRGAVPSGSEGAGVFERYRLLQGLKANPIHWNTAGPVARAALDAELAHLAPLVAAAVRGSR